MSAQVEAKFAAFPHPLLVFDRETLRSAFDYVIRKYGKDFVRLYE